MPQPQVSIIGAGLGGLTLARSLLNHGIPYVLYEKSSSPPRHGYGITLYPSSYRPLLKMLDLDETTFRRRTAVDGPIGGSGLINPKLIGHGGDIESGSFRANRGKLEQLLREGLNIQWEHTIEKIETTPSETTLRFQNGQSQKSSYTIGADGPHSNTRKCLSPDAPLTILPFVAFNGKRRIDRATFDSLYAPSMKDSTVIERKRNDTILHISVNDQTEDQVSVSWIYSRPSRGTDDVLYKPNRLNSQATDIPVEFYQEVKAIQDLEQPFQDIFDDESLRKERILHWLMRSTLVSLTELQAFAEKGVGFLGDAVHAEPILGGEGANAAIVDGIDLADCIAKNGVEGVSAWYDERYPMWEKSVEQSKRAIAEMHGAQKASL